MTVGGFALRLPRLTFKRGCMAHDYTRDALLAAADSSHAPDCLTHKYRVPSDGLCSCHVG